MNGLGIAEAVKVIAYDKERILGMQLITNTDHNKYGTLIKHYNREYLGEINKYLKTLQDIYNLWKGWNKHENPGQTYPSKIRGSFNTAGEENGEALVNGRAKRP